MDGVFLDSGLVLQRGIQLGTGTNNNAEALALTTAVKTALRFNFWVAEQLAKFAQHSSV